MGNRIFTRLNGDCPVEEFLDGLGAEDVVYATNAIGRLEEHGLALDRPYVGLLRDHVRELRIRVHRRQHRILFFYLHPDKFVLLLGLAKKSNQVRDADIEKAIEYRNDYVARVKR